MWGFLACRWLSSTGTQVPFILWFHFPLEPHQETGEERREHACSFTTLAYILVLVRVLAETFKPGN